ncbi:hypothetical protein MMC28_008420 [Mycoblastus sanguinarius]|nr:hypothetical protein [Mycoblastus sanguinarius]
MSLPQHIPSLQWALSSIDWSLVSEKILVAATLALNWWHAVFGSLLLPTQVNPVCNSPTVKTPTAPRACKFRTINSSDLGQPRKLFEGRAKTEPSSTGSERPIPLALHRPNPSPQASGVPDLSQPKAKREKAKSVVFAEEKNEVHLVEKWIVRELHIHSRPNGHVRWDHYDEVWPVDRWIVPHGHDQLHFPRTRWVRDVPDSGFEDLDGDIEMLDAAGVGEQGVSTTADVLVDAFSRLRLD